MKQKLRDVLVLILGLIGAGFVGHELCENEHKANRPPAKVSEQPAPSIPVREVPIGWQPVNAEFAAALAEAGDTADRASRDWTTCWVHLGDTSIVTCPDGLVEVS